MTQTNYKKGPIFSENERRLIDAYAGIPHQSIAPPENDDGTLPTDPPSDEKRQELLDGVSEKDVKSRLKNGRGSIGRASTLFKEFNDDLHRLENYYRSVKGSPREFYILCEELEVEIERLESLLAGWKGLAQEPYESDVPDDLQSAFEPLQESVMSIDPPERFNEYNTRQKTVFWILQSEKRAEIVGLLWTIQSLDWRQQMGQLDQHNVGNLNGVQYAGQVLAGKKGLVETDSRSTTNSKAYSLTERGGAVLETITELSELDRVWQYAVENDVPLLKATEAVATNYK